MSQSPDAKAKAQRYPAELKPNPDYEYELPEDLPDGFVVVDAGVLDWADEIARAGAKRGFPRNRG